MDFIHVLLQVRGLTDTAKDDCHSKRRSPSESGVITSPKRKRFSSDDYEQDQVVGVMIQIICKIE